MFVGDHWLASCNNCRALRGRGQVSFSPSAFGRCDDTLGEVMLVKAGHSVSSWEVGHSAGKGGRR